MRNWKKLKIFLKIGGFEENGCRDKNQYNRSSFSNQKALSNIKIIISDQ